ncbi:hypothetical protein S58_09750 [Bradyrhizobium oligotrophicum S58]|uniref:Uncharacterized protein n=1 Tax=Bradyrhizobium oligotrophicum S58 TaxID=1245469 RepID=M4Z2M6_9BRAD|nr:hypothetical protein [Bradyrhizobium oligotrophicum]BAM86986.1 hypothetical protein S58_09750 [Bradyrhizobium oligotrophicum S58]
MRWLTYALAIVFSSLSTFACAQNSTLIQEQGPQWELGKGIITATGEEGAPCLNLAGATMPPEVRGARQDTLITYSASVNQVRKLQEISGYAAYFGFGSKLSISASEFLDNSLNTDISQLFMDVRVTGIKRKIDLTKVSLTSAAEKLIEIDPTGSLFTKACGDAFIHEIEDGAGLQAVVKHKAISNEVAENVRLEASAAYQGAEADAKKLREMLDKKLFSELDITTQQIGLATVPLPPFQDPLALIDHARRFSRMLLCGGLGTLPEPATSVPGGPCTDKDKPSDIQARPFRAYWLSFSQLPQAIILFQKYKRDKLLNFDPGLDNLELIVSTYEKARSNFDVITSAISNPELFEGADINKPAVLKAYNDRIAGRVSVLQSLAKNCVKSIKAATGCPLLADATIEKLPAIRMLQKCAISADEATNDGCKARARINGQCVCTKCEFVTRRITVPGDLFTRQCSGMPRNANVLTIYSGTVGVRVGGNGWFTVKPGQNGPVQGGAAQGPTPFDYQEAGAVPSTGPDAGVIRPQIDLKFCQVGGPGDGDDGCFLEPKEPPKPMISVFMPQQLDALETKALVRSLVAPQ